MSKLFLSDNPQSAIVGGEFGVPRVTVSFRQASAADVYSYLSKLRAVPVGDGAAELKIVVGHLERHVLNLTADGEDPIPGVGANLLRLHPMLLSELIRTVNGYRSE